MGLVLFVDVDQDGCERFRGSCVVNQPSMESTHTDRLDEVDNRLAGRFLITGHKNVAGNFHVRLQVRRRNILKGTHYLNVFAQKRLGNHARTSLRGQLHSRNTRGHQRHSDID